MAPSEVVRLDSPGDGRRRAPTTASTSWRLSPSRFKATLHRSSARSRTSCRTPTFTGRPGGRVVVAVEEVDRVVRLSVTDEGQGLRPEEAKLAFQRFWRRGSERPAPASGSRSCGRRPNGTAAAPTRRARFTIELPRFQEPFKVRTLQRERKHQRKDRREAVPSPLDHSPRRPHRRLRRARGGQRRPGGRRLRRRRTDSARETARERDPRRARRFRARRHHRRHHLHEQALPLGRAHRRRRLGPVVGRDRPALGDERRPRPPRAAVERRRRADRLERRQGDGLRRDVEHRLRVHPAEEGVVRRATARTRAPAGALRDHEAPLTTSRRRRPSRTRSRTTSATSLRTR